MRMNLLKSAAPLVGGGLLALIVALSATAQAAQEVFPGETHLFTTATDGSEACRFGKESNPCGPLRKTNAEAKPADNEVFTRVSGLPIIPELGVPLYATASVSNDFVIPGLPDDLVDVQISVNYDFEGTFLAVSLYTLENLLQLRIEDLDPGGPEIVASYSLAGMQRQGDQGFTDVNATEERADLPGEVAHLTVKLRRGRMYRLHFELQSSAVTFLLTNSLRASATASFNWMSVSVDEDEAELLAGHDTAVRAELAVLRADHEQLKAEHAEIISQLGGIRDDLAEIKTLLLTPPGRRPGFPEDGVPPPGQQSQAPPQEVLPPGRQGFRGRRVN